MLEVMEGFPAVETGYRLFRVQDVGILHCETSQLDVNRGM